MQRTNDTEIGAAELRVWITERSMVEDIEGLKAQLEILSFEHRDLLDERGIGSDQPWTTSKRPWSISKCVFRSSRKRAGVKPLGNFRLSRTIAMQPVRVSGQVGPDAI